MSTPTDDEQRLDAIRERFFRLAPVIASDAIESEDVLWLLDRLEKIRPHTDEDGHDHALLGQDCPLCEQADSDAVNSAAEMLEERGFATQAEQERDALAGQLAEARREYAEMDDRIDVQDLHLAEIEAERDRWEARFDITNRDRLDAEAERDRFKGHLRETGDALARETSLRGQAEQERDAARDEANVMNEDARRLRTALEDVVSAPFPEIHAALTRARAALGSTNEPEA